MARNRFGSSAHGKPVAGNGGHIPDRELDFSDIPDSTEAELRRARRLGQSRQDQAKRLILLRIDPKLLTIIRKLAARQGQSYQTMIHALLERATRKVA